MGGDVCAVEMVGKAFFSWGLVIWLGGVWLASLGGMGWQVSGRLVGRCRGQVWIGFSGAGVVRVGRGVKSLGCFDDEWFFALCFDWRDCQWEEFGGGGVSWPGVAGVGCG